MKQEILERFKRDEVVATWHLKKLCGSTAKALVELKRLEKEGVIKKHRYSTPNNYVWELVA
jgi:DNA-binding HxlR family transcriptional regulator